MLVDLDTPRIARQYDRAKGDDDESLPEDDLHKCERRGCKSYVLVRNRSNSNSNSSNNRLTRLRNTLSGWQEAGWKIVK